MIDDTSKRRTVLAGGTVALLLMVGVPTAAHAGPFDGDWTVSAGGFCASTGVGQVTILGHDVIGPSGRGRVSSSGAVTTIGVVGGMTVTGHGQIVGNVARGYYRESDGCTGPWSAVRQ